jgi:DNA topoisomerase I
MTLSANADLEFTSDCSPGIRRVRRGGSFTYLYPSGRKVADPALLTRIRRLAIPPAYRDVWICSDPQGHLQATGRDARGRKQYRYHPDWRTHRDAAKFDRMLEFGRSLPRIRRRVAQDLRKPGLPRARVVATLVRLLESTLVRIGNEEYARSNGSFGLTTLRDRHVSVRGDKLTFEFRGKSGIAQSVSVNDPVLARIVQRCADIPGQELFQWIDADGERHRIDSADVNEYLREASGGPFTAKDYRTWFATVEALQALRKRPVGNKGEVRRQLVATVAAVAKRLGNTPSICRKCYIHPEVLIAYEDGRLARLNGAKPAAALRGLLRRREAPRTRSSKRTPTVGRA